MHTGIAVCRAETTNISAVADTTLHEFAPDFNYGGGQSITAGGRNMGGRARALLRFDIASRLPAGAVVNSATLTLTAINMVNGAGSTFDLHRVLGAWGEGAGSDTSGSTAGAGEATWNDRLAPDTAWTSPGGDYAGTSSASKAIGDLGSYTFASPGLAADVQLWLDNPAANFGWLLRSQSETTGGTIRRFGARTHLSSPPQLLIDYSLASSPPVPPELFDLGRVGNEFRFAFQAESNRTYTVEFRDSLGLTNWNVLTNIPALPGAATIRVTNEVVGSERYFRARTP